MASIGDAWADGAWDASSWAAGAWNTASLLSPIWNAVPNITRQTNKAVAVNFAQWVASGVTPITYTVTSGTLPTGITLDSGGVASGTVTSAGTAAGIGITATNASGAVESNTFSWITRDAILGAQNLYQIGVATRIGI